MDHAEDIGLEPMLPIKVGFCLANKPIKPLSQSSLYPDLDSFVFSTTLYLLLSINTLPSGEG